jgi:signal transduction histidine kinase
MAVIDIFEELSATVTVFKERSNREGINLILNAGNVNKENNKNWCVYGDKHRIRQVLGNIIDNAIKYSNKNSEIIVDIRKAFEGFSKNVVITITDKGCGISRADLPHVKMKFFKANNTRRGSGIGLAVANEIVTMHSGRLDIKSAQGKGTTVKITLPIADITKDNEKKTEV